MTDIGRLTKRPEYLRVAAARRKWVTPGMVVQALPHAQSETAPAGTDPKAEGGVCARLGITVSRKVGKSVQRNRARRRLRAVAREVLPQEAAPGTDYVLIGRAGTLTRSYADLQSDLRTAVRRLNSAAGDANVVAKADKPRRRSRRGGRGRAQADTGTARNG